jgi:hypothetical protein
MVSGAYGVKTVRATLFSDDWPHRDGINHQRKQLVR